MKKLLIILSVALVICVCGCQRQVEVKDQEEPTTTPALTESERQDLTIEKSGYWFDEFGSGWFGLIIDNPNPNWAAQNIQVSITGKNDAGQTVGAETHYVNVLFANGKTGLGGQTFIDGATSLEFQIVQSSNMWVEDDTQQAQMDAAFSVGDLAITDNGYGGFSVAGQVTSSAQKDIQAVPINVLLFDANGNIVMGAQTYIQTLTPGSTLPFEADFYSGSPEYAEAKAYVGFGYSS